LWLLAIASLGSGMFHPAGTMVATLLGRDVLKGRETTAASFFFLFGQIGLFLGPLLAGKLLDDVGVYGLLWVCLATLPIGLFGLSVLPKRGIAAEEKEEQIGPVRVKQAGWVLLAFAVLAAFQSWSQQNMVTYLPKHLSDLGRTPTQYGVIASIFWVGSAIGNVVAGHLADKYGKRRVAGIALALAIFPVVMISQIGWSPWLYLIVPLAGAFTGATHSIIVVLAQRLIPSGMGLAAGLILGFMFGSGALGALLSGYFADLFGFPAMFLATAGLVLVAAVLTTTLQKT
jgi:FSR family fosmidomycin resistance protein-like MFS transporter